MVVFFIPVFPLWVWKFYNFFTIFIKFCFMWRLDRSSIEIPHTNIHF